MSKKYIVITVSVLLVVIGGYFFVHQDSSQQAAITKIASTTQNQIDGYTTSTREQLQQELKTRSLTNAETGTEISHRNLSFATPWGEPTATEPRGRMTVFSFTNGNSILVRRKEAGSPQQALKRIDSDLPNGNQPSLTLFADKLGKGFSGYEFINYILSVNPGDISASNTAKEARRKSYALSLRAVMIPQGQPFKFEDGSKKGFIFSGNTTEQIWVWINGKQHSLVFDEGVSKSAVDTVIQTLQLKNSQQNADYFTE